MEIFQHIEEDQAAVKEHFRSNNTILIILAQYCGTMKNWVYHGAVAFSRNAPVLEEEMSQIEAALRDHGFSPDNFCAPQYVGCNNVR